MNQDSDWPLGPLTPEELPEGDEYVVGFRGHDRKPYYDRPKVRLDFEVIEPAAYAGLVVSLFANYRELGRGFNRRQSSECKYYQLWVMANGGPPKGERMTPRVFHGYWKVRIRWGKTTPVVDLLERVAGGPKK